MIPHICLVSHKPPETYGDCLRACIASFFAVPNAEDVPHFTQLANGEQEQTDALLRTWLAERGFKPFLIGIVAPKEDMFAMMATANKDIPYLLFCQANGGDHVVIAMNDAVIHDPAWINVGVDYQPDETGMWSIVVFVPIMDASAL